MTYQEIHTQAVECARHYKKSEINLLEILERVNREKVYFKMGYPSLFTYCVEALSIPPNQVYILNGIAKKAQDIPELKHEIAHGGLTLSNARRIVTVLTKENKTEWIAKAKALPQRELEREVAKIHPKAIKPDSLKVVTGIRSELRVTLPAEAEVVVTRLREVLSSKFKRPVALDEAVLFALKETVNRLDPLEKAKRGVEKSLKRDGTNPPQRDSGSGASVPTMPTSDLSQKRHIPARVQHQVVLRDSARCTYVLGNGNRCGEKTWVQLHHLKHTANGGAHLEYNLRLLCASHHRLVHERDAAKWKAVK